MVKAPGKANRNGISLTELFEMFPDDEAAERWFVESRWPDGIRCVFCEGRRHRYVRLASDPTVPLPGLPQAVQRQGRLRDARFQAGIPNMGNQHLLGLHQSQGRVEHEAAPRSGHHAKDGVAPASPHPRGLPHGRSGL